MAANSPIKQHFIPECYLKGFSNNNKNLYVYDKHLSKVYCKAFGHVGYKNLLYTSDNPIVVINRLGTSKTSKR